ncbi:MAG: hypothetical protein WCL10_18830 [Novosphingobium sp.]|uniref:hypothetical protein n=1 Tax=Novosphingobium sp. TaxID=1874826 RepID=UPI003015955E
MREKLEEAWERAYPDCRIAWMRNRFTRLLDAEAWLDAAMMLTPKDWHMDLRGVNSGWWCRINPTADGTTGEWDAYCSTPAEALLAAIEKARTVT